MTAVALTPLAFDEAKALFAQIRDAQDNWMELVIKAHDQKAWASVGYRSWDECVRTEFKISKRHANRILQYSKVYEVIAAEVGPDGLTPSEFQARPLAQLETPQEQREAWTEAVETSNGKPTAEHVETVVKRRRAKTEEPPPHAPDPADPSEEPPGPNDPEPNYPASYLVKLNWDAAKPHERLELLEYIWETLGPEWKGPAMKHFWRNSTPEQRSDFREYQEANP